MSTIIGFSSELYYLEPQDIVNLPDSEAKIADICDDVVILLGNEQQNTPDSLVCGRELVNQAIAAHTSHIPVRFAFVSNLARWNILPIFFKGLRQYFKFKSQNVYHTTLQHLRALHIERGFRNAQNAYAISKRWHISPEERVRRYNRLVESLKTKGFDDQYPISIMLCRRCGIKDCVDDGHHRIGVCAENHIERIALNFRAAGAMPHWLQKQCLRIFSLFGKHPN